MDDDKGRPYVKAECISCGKARKIYAGEVEPGDHPMCDDCMMPLVPITAQVKFE